VPKYTSTSLFADAGRPDCVKTPGAPDAPGADRSPGADRVDRAARAAIDTIDTVDTIARATTFFREITRPLDEIGAIL
jgi:hypothetical protein